jgi:glycosyltransferase involved in cell wall biosynthesis
MRILLIGTYPPPFGGVATYVEQLARLLREAGHECVVLTTLQPGHEYPEHVAALRWLPRWLTRMRPDVVHDAGRLTLRPAFDREEVLALLLLAGWPSRVVASLHHGGVAAQLRTGGTLRRRLTRWKCFRVAHFMADTEEIQSAMCDFGVPARRTTVVDPYLPIAWRSVPVRRSIAGFLDRHRPVVGTSQWRMVPYYGLHLTLDVVKALRGTFPEIGLFVSLGSGDGDAEYSAQIRATIEREGLQPHVHINTEDVGRDEFLTVLARLDAVVRPSFLDANSVSVYEALYLGVPVVASDADRRPERATVFRSGQVDDYRAKLSAVLAAGRTGNGATSPLARRAAANFDKILEVYQKVGSAGRQPA